MALKERVQKRIDGMKVEGSWRMKLAVYGGAVLMVGGILLVMYLLLGGIGSTPQVGTVTVRSSSGEVTPLSNQIYTTTRGDRTESRRLVPGEVGDSAPRWSLTTPPPYCPRAARTTGTSPLPSTTRRAASTPRRRITSSAPRSPAPTWCARSFYWGTQRENIRHGVLFLD